MSSKSTPWISLRFFFAFVHKEVDNIDKKKKEKNFVQIWLKCTIF